MRHDTIPTDDPDAWIDQIFDCPAVRNGGLFRTSLRAVYKGVGMARFKQEVDQRGFRALENNGHIVVFCNTEPVEILVSGGHGGT